MFRIFEIKFGLLFTYRKPTEVQINGLTVKLEALAVGAALTALFNDNVAPWLRKKTMERPRYRG